jgi:hypothetical protein
MATMLTDYRAWLRSELDLLGNASHHAYAFGQANMAKRAIERFDAEVGPAGIAVAFERGRVVDLLTELEALAERSDLPPALAALAETLRATTAAA